MVRPGSGSLRSLHYAWIVAAVTFLVLLVTAGIRATPGVLMVPLEHEFGWNRAAISAAVALNIALFGLIGPFAASVMQRWGLRRIILAAIALLAIAVGLSTRMRCCGACSSAPAPASPRSCSPPSSPRAGSMRGVAW
jgi:MFS family permease